MIIQEIVTIHNKTLRHTYSTENKYIKQIETDAIYNEAFDTLKRDYHYIETNQTIEEDVPQI